MCKGSLITRKSAFVVRLLNSVNSTWSSGREDDDETAKKIFTGGTASRPAKFGESIRTSIPMTSSKVNCYDFFKKNLNEQNTNRNFFNIVCDTSAIFNFETFCIMCTNIFNDFVVLGEPLSKTFEEYYQEACIRPFGLWDTNIEICESEYILDSKNHCPLCKNGSGQLTININGTAIRNFRIAKIYPDKKYMSPELEREIRLLDPYASKEINERNQIALCLYHYEKYSRAPDIDSFKTLKVAKREIMFLKDFNEKVNSLDFTRIEGIIECLNSHTPQLSKENLSLKVKNVQEKIPPADDYWLNCHVIDMINRSYKVISSYMSDYEMKKGGSTELGEKIKKLSSDLMLRHRGPSYVFNTLVETLSNFIPDVPNNKMYCEFIVAYFIAHCEVLTQYEIAK